MCAQVCNICVCMYAYMCTCAYACVYMCAAVHVYVCSVSATSYRYGILYVYACVCVLYIAGDTLRHLDPLCLTNAAGERLTITKS